jgi:hypothetical protein
MVAPMTMQAASTPWFQQLKQAQELDQPSELDLILDECETKLARCWELVHKMEGERRGI